MSDSEKKQRPSGELTLALSTSRNLPALRLPDVKAPFGGRAGKQVANEMREKYFRLWHNMIMERLALESTVVLSAYARQVIDDAINQMIDQHLNTERRQAANALMEGFTEWCIQQMVAAVRAILENHPRRLGEIL